MYATTSPERAAIIRAGAQAARDNVPRSDNPHPCHGEDWINWMDGYDHQIAWLETGRGVYEPFPNHTGRAA
jgi:hypothetical protein